MKRKNIIGLVLLCIGLLGMLGCVIAWWALRFQNPDITELRVLMEFPEPSVYGVVFFILAIIGKNYYVD